MMHLFKVEMRERKYEVFNILESSPQLVRDALAYHQPQKPHPAAEHCAGFFLLHLSPSPALLTQKPQLLNTTKPPPSPDTGSDLCTHPWRSISQSTSSDAELRGL
ncbi:hypothetical protein Droror1_Dr00000823 [Drosera rotundifolia]